jgi:hypothetical protein
MRAKRYGYYSSSGAGEMSERKPLSDIAVGDRVWISSGHGRDRAHMGTVGRMTRTQVILDVPKNREKYNRYKIATAPPYEGAQLRFYEVGAGSFSQAITSIATPDECEAWDRQQAEKAQARADREAELERIEVARRALSELFDGKGYVSHDNGEWHVNLWFKDESDVRRLAELIPQLEQGK